MRKIKDDYILLKTAFENKLKNKRISIKRYVSDYERGIKQSLSILERLQDSDYEKIQDSLSNELHKKPLTNRTCIYNEAILSCMSICSNYNNWRRDNEKEKR